MRPGDRKLVFAIAGAFTIFAGMRARVGKFMVAILAAASPVWLFGQNPGMESLLEELDRTLDNRTIFENEKRHTIDSVRALRRPSLPPEVQYRINKEMIELYKSYSYDSAMHYVGLNRELADRLRDVRLSAESGIDYSNLLLKGGLFMETIKSLGRIDRRTLPDDLVDDYYLCHEQLYHHMSRYTAGTPFEREYSAVSMAWVDSLRSVVGEDSDHYLALSRIYISNPDRRIARALLQNLLDRLEVGSHACAIVSATLAECYDQTDPEESRQREKYLITSAISDITSTVKEYVSLSNLAGSLYLEGDLDRAYRYGTISMEDANFYNARLRRIELSLIFPIIERAYKAELDRHNARLRGSVIAISLLAVVLLGLMIYVWRQTVVLRRIRQALIETNERLAATNRSLFEANHIKEEYLGRFLSMCSGYIDKMERYQSSALNRLNAGKMDELRAMVRSSSVLDHEIREFYQNFDRAFLKIFPGFVSKFNSLLRENERIVVPTGELLTTELRIFALIRLGIGDSSQIAKFLRYSANTVYTYRTKIKNKAVDRANFESDLMSIDL
jgi:DNA-binding NarL/FixJ family response regulator